MNKLLLLGLSFVAIPIGLHATDATITLTPNFLKYEGTYKFDLDVSGLVTADKAWNVIVQNGQATIKGAKGIKGKHIEIKGNVISAKIGALEKRHADDLAVQALEGDLQGQFATEGVSKDSKDITVDVGPGLTLKYLDLKRSKVGEHVNYTLKIGSDLPDGSYTCKLLRPTAKNKTFRLDIKNHTIVKVSGDMEGKLVDGSLQIEATKMCTSRRAKIASAIGGAAAAVIIGTVATGATVWVAAAPAGAATTGATITAAATQAGVGFIEATMMGEAAAATAATASSASAIAASIAAATGVGLAEATAIVGIAKAMEEGKSFGGTVMGAMFGFKECTLQITCDEGPTDYKGKAVKVDYQECRKNIWELNAIETKILITGK